MEGLWKANRRPNVYVQPPICLPLLLLRNTIMSEARLFRDSSRHMSLPFVVFLDNNVFVYATLGKYFLLMIVYGESLMYQLA